MTDLTKITTPFGLLDAKTQQALRDHLAAGGELEVYNNGWRNITDDQLADLVSFFIQRIRFMDLNERQLDAVQQDITMGR
jgi:hypothetical protein